MRTAQEIVDVLSASLRSERAGYHLTLGALIAALERADPLDLVIFDDGASPGLPTSYRGYYSDLAFPTITGTVTAGELLAVCRWCLGCIYTGYKGGDYLMDERTPLWRSAWGEVSGLAIVSVIAGPGRLVLETRRVE